LIDNQPNKKQNNGNSLQQNCSQQDQEAESHSDVSGSASKAE